MTSPYQCLALVPTFLLTDAGVGAGILMTLTGTVLNVFLPRLQTAVEEQVKKHKLTDRAAGRKIRLYRRSGFFITLMGELVLVLVMLDLISRASD